MTQSKFKIAMLGVALVGVVLLSGCASDANPNNMVFQGSQNKYDGQLTNNIHVNYSIGGSETDQNAMFSEISNTSFTEALKRSLAQQGLLSVDGEYTLQAHLVGVKLRGRATMTATTSIEYTLTVTDTNKTIWKELLVTSHTAKALAAFAGVTRHRFANENSVKKGIGLLLDKLAKLEIADGTISVQ